MCVGTRIGNIVDRKCKNCFVIIGGSELLVNPIIMDMQDFYVILGMYWLSAHYATLYYWNQLVNFQIPSQPEFSFIRNGAYVSYGIIST